MKLIQENLAKAADLMARLTPKKGFALMPELNCVRLTNAPGVLVITSAHGEGGAQVRVAAANTGEPLDLLVGAQVFSDLLKTCAAGEIIELAQIANHTLNVRWPRAASHIRGLNAEAVGLRHVTPWNCHGVKPAAQDSVERTELAFDADVLRGIIPQVAFAAATDEQRPVLTGLLLEVEGGRAALAAANGFHMMRVQFSTAQPTVKTRVVLPAKFCGHLVSLLSAVDDETATQATLTVLGNTVLADYGPGAVWGQLIEGMYPDLTAIIPKSFAAVARVGQGAALRVVKGAQAMNKDRASIQLRPGLFAMYAVDAETGDTHPLTNAGGGDELTALINPKYIGDAIRAMPKGELEIKGNGPTKPVCITPNADVLYVLMPLQPGDKYQAPPEPQADLFAAANADAEAKADAEEEGIVTNAALHALAAASYSGDKMNGGKIRKPFIWKSAPYICIGKTNGAVECERLVPEAEWQGEKTTYEKAAKLNMEVDAERLETKGIVVACGAKRYVLTGERLTVTLPLQVAA